MRPSGSARKNSPSLQTQRHDVVKDYSMFSHLLNGSERRFRANRHDLIHTSRVFQQTGMNLNLNFFHKPSVEMTVWMSSACKHPSHLDCSIGLSVGIGRYDGAKAEAHALFPWDSPASRPVPDVPLDTSDLHKLSSRSTHSFNGLCSDCI